LLKKFKKQLMLPLLPPLVPPLKPRAPFEELLRAALNANGSNSIPSFHLK
jgi:hypothetical protein